jgi:hypothetical protein
MLIRSDEQGILDGAAEAVSAIPAVCRPAHLLLGGLLLLIGP